jgi:hypothetical protein
MEGELPGTGQLIQVASIAASPHAVLAALGLPPHPPGEVGQILEVQEEARLRCQPHRMNLVCARKTPDRPRPTHRWNLFHLRSKAVAASPAWCTLGSRAEMASHDPSGHHYAANG